MGGWLAGLPVVAGPILYVLALEQGNAFAANAAAASLAAVFASVSFSVAYAHVCARNSWRTAVLTGLIAWLCAASLLSVLAPPVYAAAALAFVTLLVAPRAFPAAVQRPRSLSRSQDLLFRMAAGAALATSVALVAPRVGSYWSGLLAVFPVLGVVLAVFSHREQGAPFAASLLKGMAIGLYSFSAFCLSLTLTLDRLGTSLSFGIAIIAAISAQALTKRLPSLSSNEKPSATVHVER